ncbi:50S ribosomal protein L25 [Ralstonia solanacearum]|nr:50S ribosomal protein L25 [Ralstonia solanacearum]
MRLRAVVRLGKRTGIQDMYYIPTMGGLYLLNISVFDRPVEDGHQLAQTIADSVQIEGKF